MQLVLPDYTDLAQITMLLQTFRFLHTALTSWNAFTPKLPYSLIYLWKVYCILTTWKSVTISPSRSSSVCWFRQEHKGAVCEFCLGKVMTCRTVRVSSNLRNVHTLKSSLTDWKKPKDIAVAVRVGFLMKLALSAKPSAQKPPWVLGASQSGPWWLTLKEK